MPETLVSLTFVREWIVLARVNNKSALDAPAPTELRQHML